jgi:curli biogenesis system outer membrane secretion channel CsgG
MINRNHALCFACALAYLLSAALPAQTREAERIHVAMDGMAGQVADAIARGGAPTAAVIEFGGVSPLGEEIIVSGGSAGAFGRWFASSFTDKLVLASSGRFSVIERARVDKLLEEQELALSGLASDKARMRAGQLLVARALVFGSVMAVDERSANVSFRVVDAETGAILGAFPRRVAMTSDVAALLGLATSSPTLASLSAGSASPFSVRVLSGGKPKTEYVLGKERWILAKPQEAYAIELRNDSDKRVGVALFIDGINTAFMRRELPSSGVKWVLEPKSVAIIPGWQADMGTARAFVFTGRDQSLAAGMGYSAEIGIISASFYVETRDPAKGEQNSGMAGTGAGDALGHQVTAVSVSLESAPAEVIVLRYDYRKGLEDKGIKLIE